MSLSVLRDPAVGLAALSPRVLLLPARRCWSPSPTSRPAWASPCHFVPTISHLCVVASRPGFILALWGWLGHRRGAGTAGTCRQQHPQAVGTHRPWHPGAAAPTDSGTRGLWGPTGSCQYSASAVATGFHRYRSFSVTRAAGARAVGLWWRVGAWSALDG